MSHAASQPKLRLVGIEDDRGEWSRHESAKLEIVKENRIASMSGLDPNDPRWILAMQTQARLQGATLTPDKRDQLLQSGQKLGLRAFETNLVIAIVQDRARSGLRLDHAAKTLALLPSPVERTADASQKVLWPRWFAAISAALALAALLIRWLAPG